MALPLFLLGNKRSGTSHLTRLLNAHPRIYIAPEADLVWALYRRSRSEAIERYPLDGPGGLERTLRRCAAAFADGSASTEQVFERAMAIMARLDGKTNDDLAWAGDKKPVQHADPNVFAFIRSNWPEAKFLHIVRHPAAVIASKKAALAKQYAFMDVWNRSDEELLAFWTQNEQHVLRHKATGASIFSLTLQALIEDPTAGLRGLLEFLQLPDDPGCTEFARSTTVPQDDKYLSFKLSLSQEAKIIVDHYLLK